MSYFDDNEDYLTVLRMPWHVQDAMRGANMADANKQATKVITGEVRLSFVHVLEPDSFNGQEPRYSVMILIPKDDKTTLGRIKKTIEAATEYGKSTLWGGKVPKNLHMPLRDGDDEMDGKEFDGMYFMRVSSRNAPGVIDRHKQPIEDTNGIYSGCYGRVSLNMFPYDKAGNRGISAGLNNVQVLRDGDPLGGRSRAEDDFDDDFCDRYEDEDPFEDGEGLDDLLGL